MRCEETLGARSAHKKSMEATCEPRGIGASAFRAAGVADQSGERQTELASGVGVAHTESVEQRVQARLVVDLVGAAERA